MGFTGRFSYMWKKRIKMDSTKRSIWISDLYVPFPPFFSISNKKGVLLGTGTSSLMLSLLPGKVLKVSQFNVLELIIDRRSIRICR